MLLITTESRETIRILIPILNPNPSRNLNPNPNLNRIPVLITHLFTVDTIFS